MRRSLPAPFAFVTLVCAALLLAACDADDLALGLRGSGDIVRQTVDVDDFDRIDIRNAFEVTLHEGPHSAVIEIDDNLVDLVDVSTRNGRFNLGLETDDTPRNATLRVTITMPAVAEIHAAGAVRINAEGPIPIPGELEIRLSGAAHLGGDFEASAVDISVSGASSLGVVVETPRLELDASGASDIELSGFADELELELSGASSGELRNLTVLIGSVELSGASDATITVTERLTRVNLSRDSRLDYFGNAVIDSQPITGASSIRQR